MIAPSFLDRVCYGFFVIARGRKSYHNEVVGTAATLTAVFGVIYVAGVLMIGQILYAKIVGEGAEFSVLISIPCFLSSYVIGFYSYYRISHLIQSGVKISEQKAKKMAMFVSVLSVIFLFSAYALFIP